MSIYNVISFLGIFVLLGFAWLCSSHRGRMNWRAVGWAVGLQLLFGLFIFVVPGGRSVFLWLNDIVVKILDCSAAGTRFVFGSLAIPPGEDGSLGFILAFQALPTIVFFSALMAILYHVRIMPLVIKGFARAFTRLMRISGAESLCAASNIFVGIESALVVRPHLKDMTHSEFCTVLAAGMATVASNVLLLYVSFLKEQFPTIAGHLISASILSAPAALAMAKVLLPETEEPKTRGQSIEPHYEQEDNVFAAIVNGAQGGMKMIFGIVAVLIAVLGLVALINAVLGWASFGMDLSLQKMLGWCFYPFTVVLGVPLEDAAVISAIIGERLVLTEVASYQHLAGAVQKGAIAHPRSVVITTYALCGFAHVASMGIFVGGLTALVPERRADIASVGFRALLAATLACLMTACIAGTFYLGQESILGLAQ